MKIKQIDKSTFEWLNNGSIVVWKIGKEFATLTFATGVTATHGGHVFTNQFNVRGIPVESARKMWKTLEASPKFKSALDGTRSGLAKAIWLTGVSDSLSAIKCKLGA